MTLPTVVVSPSLTPTPVEQVASSVTVITAEEIQRTQRRTLPDVLSTVPGLNVVRTGGPGGQTSIFMRGTNSQHVKVLIDGIDVSDPSTPNGAPDFGNYLTDDIERIEVLRGPQSGLYGANAIGGVISITTKKGSGPPKVRASVEGGSFSTFNQAASLSGSQKNVDYSFNVTHFHAGNTPVTPAYVVPPGATAMPNYYDNTTYSTRLGAAVTDDLSVNFVARYIDAKLLFTEVLTGPRSTGTYKAFYTRGEAVWKTLDGRLTQRFGAAFSDTARDNTTPPGTVTNFEGTRNKIDWRGDFVLAPGHTIIAGLERDNEQATGNLFNVKTGNQAAYAEIQSQFAERLFLTGNIRGDDHDQFGSHMTYRLAAAFVTPVTNTKLKATYGTGFKAPTLYELYGVGSFSYLGNPTLRPEESIGYDVGFEQPLFNGRVKFGGTYYENRIKNLINSLFIFGPPTVNTYVNVGQAKMHGSEWFAEVIVTDQLRLRGDFTRTMAFDSVANTELLRRPNNKGSISATWQPTDKSSLTATVLSVGSWIDAGRVAPFGATQKPGYTIVNLAGEYAIHPNATVFARVDNLFDKRYEKPYGWEQPSLSVYGGVRATY
ncbi:MAG: TonB-dependent receptor [Pseudolabrys sp.]|nr:TonB-dependent receptor [Pseudolabrys sp.]MDP2294830.1 TonB-dependent receptor [Pseudolabrys sp.]